MTTNAIVARATDHGLAFLTRLAGRTEWTDAETEAEAFASVRDATRAALRLPSRYRAFALPNTASALRHAA
jgi:hypothetical protein